MGTVNCETTPDFDALVFTPVIIYEGASRSSKTESVMKYALTFVTGYCFPFLGFRTGPVCLPLLKASLELTWDCM
jgi:hypothetical protein